MEEALKDERFRHVLTDPRFRKIPKHVQRVTVDKRFKGMFKDKKFKSRCIFDKRGRSLDLKQSENLKNLYDISSESSDETDEEEEETNKGEQKVKEAKTSFNLLSGKQSTEENNNSVAVHKKNYINKGETKQYVKSIPGEHSFQICNEQDESSENDSCEKLSNESLLNRQKESTNENGNFEKKSINLVKTKLKGKQENLTSEKIYTKIKYNKKENEERLNSDDESEDNDESDDTDDDDESNDTDDDESDDSGDLSEDFDHQWEELRNEAPDTDEITRRIAVCNMDWDRIRAEDLFACFNSFKPADGYINSIKIYPSDYGLKRMEEEKIHGPPELIEETLPLDAEESDDKNKSKYHREKLRQYQINRLKYYYAVVDCDLPETANTLYEQLNGMEYESSSVRFDLRFIPDDMTFDHEPISIADKTPDPTNYKPRQFVTTALQQVKVNLTWDETDPKRREILQKAFTEPDSIEKDIQDYLASSSGESEIEGVEDSEETEHLKTKDCIAKYRELLLSLEEKEKEENNKYEMEITWDPGLKEKTEKIVKEKMKNDSLNPFEEMIQKKKEKKLKKKGKTIQKEDEDFSESSDNDDFFSKKPSESKVKDEDSKKLAELALISDSKKIANFEENVKKKGKAQKLDNFKLDVNDPRFSAIYSSHLFNIDPSNPHYKDNEGNRALIQEKQKHLSSIPSYGKHKSSKRVKYS